MEGQKMPIRPAGVHECCELPDPGSMGHGAEFHCFKCGRVWRISSRGLWFLHRTDARVEPDSHQVGGDHYQTGAHEPFLVIDEWSSKWPAATVFYLASALKYVARLGRKGDADAWRQDLDKAIHYMQEARKRLG